jgi:hypothetical protein
MECLMLDPDLFLGDPQLLEGHVELLERLGQCGIDRRWAVHPEPEPASAVTDGMQVFEKGLVVHRRPPPHGAPSALYPGHVTLPTPTASDRPAGHGKADHRLAEVSEAPPLVSH